MRYPLPASLHLPINPLQTRRRWLRLGLFCMLAPSSHLLFAAPPLRQLRLGLAAEVTSMDPHWSNSGPNNALLLHIFEPLVFLDRNGRYAPGLALSWRLLDPYRWEIRLRPGVKWHDGTPLTAEDVQASLARPEQLANSPGSFTSYTKSIARIDILDPLTLHIQLKIADYASLPNDLNSVAIIPKRMASLSPRDFDQGRAMVGTGPFRFIRYARGQEIVLVQNPDYWGGAPLWERVQFRMLSNNGARTAALLAGDVDAIESVPNADMARIRLDPKLRVAQQVSWRTLFWHMDQARPSSPFVTDKTGQPLARNPFQDRRVREALSLAIRRDAIISHILEGQGLPASALVAPQIFGHPGQQTPVFDPARSRQLLAEAGYPEGFGLTLHTPSGRYQNDVQIAQATAQMLARIGLAVRVQTLPAATYFSHARQGKFSFMLLGWGSVAGDVALRSLLGTPNATTGYGTWNWGGYQNAQLDAAIALSLTTAHDEHLHEARAQAAMRLAMVDMAVIPMHHQFATWAMRKPLQYAARTDEWSLAHLFTLES